MTTTTWPFDPLRPLSYDLIMADPPWQFRLWSDKGEGKSAQAQYATMDIASIKALPVSHLAGGDCLLFMWATFPMLPEALEVMAAWGFRYVTGGAWHKRTAHSKTAFGTGYRLRSSCEPFLIGTIGNPPTTRACRNLIEAEAREHSRKPEAAFLMCERLLPAGRYLELFSRQSRAGWHTWGNESGKFTEGANAA